MKRRTILLALGCAIAFSGTALAAKDLN